MARTVQFGVLRVGVAHAKLGLVFYFLAGLVSPRTRHDIELTLRPGRHGQGAGTDLKDRSNCGVERETGVEPATFSLARRRSTTEPLPQR
jgi:hypothetical protein